MRKRVWVRLFGLVVLLAALFACKPGPPAVSGLKIGKDKGVTKPANTFGAHDTVYLVASIDNPPADGKVTGRLTIVDVEGQQPGPIPGLETTLNLTAGMNQVNFNFTAPTAGWPNGKYQFQVVLLDGAGAQKDQKNTDFTTAGNQPAAAEAPAATDSAAPAEEGSKPQQ